MKTCFNAKCWFLATAIGLIPGGAAVAEDVRPATTASDAESSKIIGISFGFPLPKDPDYLRKRIAGYADFDAAAADLTDAAGGCESAKYARLKFMPGDVKIPYVEFAQVLADRRTSRLYAFLKEMPPEEASRRTDELFEAMLEHHRTAMQEEVARCRKRARDNPGEFNDFSMKSDAASGHAVRIALFLCAAFGDPHAVLQKLDQWEATIGPMIQDTIVQLDLKGPEATYSRSYGRAESLYVLNLYAFILQRYGGLLSAQMATRPILALGNMNREPFFGYRGNFFAWDAPKVLDARSCVDFRAPNFQAVPQEDPNAILVVAIAVYWQDFRDEAKQKEVLTAVRELVEAL